MPELLDSLAAVATVFAVPQFVPQLARVWSTGDTAGVSWSWAALTSVSNGGWIAYFALSHYWTALLPSTSVTVLAGVLASRLASTAATREAGVIAMGWAALLTLAWVTTGRAGLGTALTVSFVLQVTPALWTAYHTERPSGISIKTWLLIFAELLCWGAYGLHKSDPRLTALGATGVAASVLMLARIRHSTAQEAGCPAETHGPRSESFPTTPTTFGTVLDITVAELAVEARSQPTQPPRLHSNSFQGERSDGSSGGSIARNPISFDKVVRIAEVFAAARRASLWSWLR